MSARGAASSGTLKWKQIVVRVDSECLKRLESIADHYEVPVSDAVRRSINCLYKELTQ